VEHVPDVYEGNNKAVDPVSEVFATTR
jgi:hypothetical protein